MQAKAGRLPARKRGVLRGSAPPEGDNSNQCAGIQGVANTGNAQNVIDFIQYGSTADDFEFDDVNSSIDVSVLSSPRRVTSRQPGCLCQRLRASVPKGRRAGVQTPALLMRCLL